MDEDIVTADTNNHRIQVFEKTGEFKYQFGIPGKNNITQYKLSPKLNYNTLI